jgi:hypothetical protein
MEEYTNFNGEALESTGLDGFGAMQMPLNMRMYFVKALLK